MVAITVGGKIYLNVNIADIICHHLIKKTVGIMRISWKMECLFIHVDHQWAGVVKATSFLR